MMYIFVYAYRFVKICNRIFTYKLNKHCINFFKNVQKDNLSNTKLSKLFQKINLFTISLLFNV